MKNQPPGPGCAIACMVSASIATLALAYDLGWFIPAIGVNIICSLILWLYVAKMDSRNDAEVDESGEILTMTWSAEGSRVRDMVAELRRPGTNSGRWMWRPGWNAKRLEREYGQLLEILK